MPGPSGNPVGSARVAAAAKRLSREQESLKSLSFSVDAEQLRNLPVKERNRVSDLIPENEFANLELSNAMFVASVCPTALQIARNGQAVMVSEFLEAVKVIRDCEKVIKTFKK